MKPRSWIYKRPNQLCHQSSVICLKLFASRFLPSIAFGFCQIFVLGALFLLIASGVQITACSGRGDIARSYIVLLHIGSHWKNISSTKRLKGVQGYFTKTLKWRKASIILAREVKPPSKIGDSSLSFNTATTKEVRASSGLGYSPLAVLRVYFDFTKRLEPDLSWDIAL
jgi:hypothetical protein